MPILYMVALQAVKGLPSMGTWQSFTTIGGYLMAIGLAIRGTVIFIKAVTSDSGNALSGIIQLVLAILVYTIIQAFIS